MADIADVETALAGLCAQALGLGAGYQTQVVATSPVAGVACKVLRGWPTSAQLNADLKAGVSTISVFPLPGMARLTTRYPAEWQSTGTVAPTLTALASGSAVTFGGAGGAGQVAGVAVGTGAAPIAYAYRLAASDTPSTVAAGFAALIPGASASGAVLTCPGPAQALVVADQPALMEVRRQVQGVAVTCWCPTPDARDAVGRAVDGGLAGLMDGNGNPTEFFALADGTAGRLRYVGSVTDDAPAQANLWRRDLRYSVEYPTTLAQAQPEMLFGVSGENGVQTFAVGAQAKPARPLIGAIRWDGFYGASSVAGSIAAQVAAALSPAAYNARLPFFATVSGGVASWPAATQAVMDAEIAAAALAGLGYWAFDSFQPGDVLSTALGLYLSSAQRGLIGFCMVGQISNWNLGGGAPYAASVQRDIGLFGQPGYVHVAGGRPLYYVLDSGDPQAQQQAAIAWVRAQSIAAGQGTPYVVWLSGAHLSQFDNTGPALAVGADAAGAYACPILRGVAQSYAQLVTDAEGDWTLRAAKALPMVPTAMAGWDQRPLVQTPQPYYPLGGYNTLTNYYAPPTPAALAQHVADLAAFVAANPAACPANVGLVYAWNEIAEGGWLMPTWQVGNPAGDVTRALALGPVLNPPS